MAEKITLLVLDVMSGIFELEEPLTDPDGFLDRLELLLSRVRARGIPVIFFRHRTPGGRLAAGSPAGELHPRLRPRPAEIVLDKAHPDAFQATDLEAHLRQLEAEQLLVCGFASEGCVDATVRSAYAKGFSVVLVSDCHTTTRNPVLEGAQIVAHHNFVLSRFAKVQPVAAIMLD